MTPTPARFEALARSDPTVAPLAALQAVVWRAASAPHWSEGVPTLSEALAGAGVPLLHGASLTVDADQVSALLQELADVAARGGAPQAERLRGALGGGRAPAGLDALGVLAASLMGDEETLEGVAGRAGVELALLALLGHLAALPLLLACGLRAAATLPTRGWDAGFCPTCAAWPLLAEARGLERQRWLRCGRCAAAWRFRGQQCAFCANDDHRMQGYFAPEAERESRQAVTCDACHHYLKTFTTVTPLAPAELHLRDLASVELDVAALEGGYTRPATLGFSLGVNLVAAPRRAGWLRWGR